MVATGTVEPVHQVNLSPAQPGIVAAINVEAGEWVRTGQVLAVMDGGDLPIRIKERQALLQQAEGALVLREEELMRQLRVRDDLVHPNGGNPMGRHPP